MTREERGYRTERDERLCRKEMRVCVCMCAREGGGGNGEGRRERARDLLPRHGLHSVLVVDRSLLRQAVQHLRGAQAVIRRRERKDTLVDNCHRNRKVLQPQRRRADAAARRVDVDLLHPLGSILLL